VAGSFLSLINRAYYTGVCLDSDRKTKTKLFHDSWPADSLMIVAYVWIAE